MTLNPVARDYTLGPEAPLLSARMRRRASV
jgi:hypothetical protein